MLERFASYLGKETIAKFSERQLLCLLPLDKNVTIFSANKVYAVSVNKL